MKGTLKKSIIVIPGLGDESAIRKVRWVVDRWNDANHEVHVFQTKWSSRESVEEKLARLEVFFDEHTGSGEHIIVAFSAGGALATVLQQRVATISKVILISAKLKGSNTIGPKYVQRAPAIIETVQASEQALSTMTEDAKRQYLCYRPILDLVVPKRDMVVDGMKQKLIPSIGHGVSIGVALLFFVRRQIQ